MGRRETKPRNMDSRKTSFPFFQACALPLSQKNNLHRHGYRAVTEPSSERGTAW